MSSNNNPPQVIVKLSFELAEMLIETCDANLRLGLSQLQNVPRPTAEKLVALMEQYKQIKKAVNEGLNDEL